MDRRQALTRIGIGGLVAAASWPALARALPKTKINSLEFHSMKDLAAFLEQAFGIKQHIPGLVCVPTIYTSDCRVVCVTLRDEVPAGTCRVNDDVELPMA